MRRKDLMAELKGFMGKMREGDMRGIVANLQAALNFSQECLRVYAEKLEEATGKKLPELTDDEKRKIARKAHMLNGNALKMIYCPWSPGTILGWYSTLIAQKYNSTGPNQKRRGRPVIPQETVDIIVRIGSNNPNWGYQRIHHYLLHLGIHVSFMTVKRILNDHGIFPSDGRSDSDFNLFFKCHENIAAADFCTHEIVSEDGHLERFHLLFFENIFTREVWCGGIAHDPDGNWMAQVARNQADMWDGKLLHTQYLIHDRDPLFQGRFPIILKSVGCRIKLIQPRCPEQNGYIESFIKTFKTECLNHVILQSEAQLRYVVNEFLIYYNRERPHSGLGGKIIRPWPQDPDGDIQEFSRLGGLLKSYRRVKTAA